MRVRHLVLLVAGLVLLGGCATLRDVPLPGLVSGPTFPVTAHFSSALGLPEQAAVRFDGAVVGEVVAVRTVGYTAVVDLKLRRAVRVPSSAHAEIRLTSPMGEAFVELAVKERRKGPFLHAGSSILIAATSEAPSATDLLASVSTLLTGGSFADMKVVLTELNTALRGNAGNVRQLVGRLDRTLTRLNDHTGQFDDALSSLSDLSGKLAGDREVLGRSLRVITPAVQSLTRQRTQILTLMSQVRRLSTSGTGSIARTRSSLSSVLRDLGPVLTTLEKNEATFAPIFAGIRDFGNRSAGAGWGSFSNFDLTILFKPEDLVQLPGAQR
ncbi:MAG: hypothetical protein JWQ74_1281 [Marmoricola sp.]|nr:hypothetical protein [Marmoricola sp.]